MALATPIEFAPAGIVLHTTSPRWVGAATLAGVAFFVAFACSRRHGKAVSGQPAAEPVGP